MASPEHSTARPCAFCGLGEGPTASKSHGICDTCAGQVLTCDNLWFEQLADVGRVMMLPVSSTNIVGAGWRTHADSGVLVLQFGNGGRFRYSNVTRQWWQAFLKADSKGSFFHTTVRANPAAHPFTKI